MKNARHRFYSNIVNKRIPDKGSSILVCGGGILDKETFLNLGYRNVTMSNLDTRDAAERFAPYKWDYQTLNH